MIMSAKLKRNFSSLSHHSRFFKEEKEKSSFKLSSAAAQRRGSEFNLNLSHCLNLPFILINSFSVFCVCMYVYVCMHADEE